MRFLRYASGQTNRHTDTLIAIVRLPTQRAAGIEFQTTALEPEKLLFVLFQDITLSTEATVEGFRTTLSYERQTWILEASLTDESRHPHVNYSSFVRLSSPTNFIDVQLISNATADAETTSGGFGLKYLTSRDRQFKTLALKAEINRIRNELALEVNTRQHSQVLRSVTCSLKS